MAAQLLTASLDGGVWSALSPGKTPPALHFIEFWVSPRIGIEKILLVLVIEQRSSWSQHVDGDLIDDDDDDDDKFCRPTCETFHFGVAEYECYLWGICPRGTEAKLWDQLHVSHSCGVHLSLRELAWNPTSWDQDPVTEWTTLVSRPHSWVSGATQKHVHATYWLFHKHSHAQNICESVNALCPVSLLR
jgi:hypothetical protein